ncbi:hypothetical protein EYF80_061925 [Liparis tanakae]|uniref:Uncharacterized protein n=1 Tax=Liparis tanakae TaxID=230148 RepID=A0A4Z2EGN4_9TELE|nr:hypothetical protein EYF80_061925 [Liparis tanakae]
MDAFQISIQPFRTSASLKRSAVLRPLAFQSVSLNRPRETPGAVAWERSAATKERDTESSSKHGGSSPGWSPIPSSPARAHTPVCRALRFVSWEEVRRRSRFPGFSCPAIVLTLVSSGFHRGLTRVTFVRSAVSRLHGRLTSPNVDVREML